MGWLIRKQPPTEAELDRELAAILGGTPVLGRGLVRAAGYTRVSSFMQVEDGSSLDDQAARIAQTVAEHGWELIEVFADPARSGRNEQRPQLARLLRAVRKNQVDVVVIDRIDRLSRHLFGLLSTMQYLKRHGVRLVSLRESIDFTTPWGRLVLYVLGALAEFYVSALSEEIRLSRLQQARNGYLTGSYRFGYCNGRCADCSDPNGRGYCPLVVGGNRSGDGTRVPHPVEAEAVRLMFAWYATGEYSDDDVARRLNREIFTLADGAEMRFRTKGLPGAHAPQAFDKDAVQALLTNAVYAGYVTYAGSDERGNRRRKPVEWFEGKHEAIISLELFRKVQTIRQNRYHRSTTLANPARVYPLTGVLYCAAQHSPLRGISSNGGDSRYYVDRLASSAWPGTSGTSPTSAPTGSSSRSRPWSPASACRRPGASASWPISSTTKAPMRSSGRSWRSGSGCGGRRSSIATGTTPASSSSGSSRPAAATWRRWPRPRRPPAGRRWRSWAICRRSGPR